MVTASELYGALQFVAAARTRHSRRGQRMYHRGHHLPHLSIFFRTPLTYTNPTDWIALTATTPSQDLPQNCRVHVNVTGLDARFKNEHNRFSEANIHDRSKTRVSPMSEDDESNIRSVREERDGEDRIGGSCKNLSPEMGAFQEDGEEILALPWRRFGGDLLTSDNAEGHGGGGLELCGTRLVVYHVSNSDEGTGLFTWVIYGVTKFLLLMG